MVASARVASAWPAEELPAHIHRLYQRLATASSLAPGGEVDALFCELVAISTSPDVEAGRVLGDPILPAIRESLWRVCSRGEFQLELHWARRIAAAPEPWRELERFPYWGNYQKLARLEVHALHSASEGPLGRLLFVGSGPLPLSSVVLAHRYGLYVTNLDMDPEADTLARRLCGRLGLEEQVDFICSDVLALRELAGFDAVLLGALVGMNRREKEQLLLHLGAHMRPGALLLVRSAQRLRSLLYPEVVLPPGGPFELLREVHPHDEVINSVLVASRR